MLKITQYWVKQMLRYHSWFYARLCHNNIVLGGMTVDSLHKQKTIAVMLSILRDSLINNNNTRETTQNN